MQEYGRRSIIAAFGCAGLISALGLIVSDGTQDLDVVDASNLQLLCVSGPCAAIAGALCVGLFGRDGGWGWFCAGIGAFCSTLLGAMLGGALLAPIYGALFAPLVLFVNFALYPVAGVVWLASMSALHLYAVRVRACGPTAR